MSDLIYTVSMPFKMKGKETLRESEFILALSIDLKWFTPEQAKNVLNIAHVSGLIKKENGNVSPLYDISTIKIPSEFKPQALEFEKKTLFDMIVERIILKTGMEKKNIIALINKNQEELLGMVEIEVSAIIVSIEHGILADDFIDEKCNALMS